MELDDIVVLVDMRVESLQRELLEALHRLRWVGVDANVIPLRISLGAGIEEPSVSGAPWVRSVLTKGRGAVILRLLL